MEKMGYTKGVNLKKFKFVFWNMSWQDNTNIHDNGVYAYNIWKPAMQKVGKAWTLVLKTTRYMLHSQLNILIKLYNLA